MTNFFELLFASALLILSLGLSQTGTWSLPTSSLSTSNEIHSSSIFSSSSEELELEEERSENEHGGSYPQFNPSFRDSHNFIEGDSSVCGSHRDCSSNYCCTVGMMRYSIPTCLPMGQLGDACIPANSPRNFTLSYPNGEQLTAIDSFKLLCPCAPGYLCDEDSVSCLAKSRAKEEEEEVDGAKSQWSTKPTTRTTTTLTTTTVNPLPMTANKTATTNGPTTQSHENYPHPVLMKQSEELESKAKDLVLKKH